LKLQDGASNPQSRLSVEDQAGAGLKRRKVMKIFMGLFAVAAAILLGSFSNGEANPVAKSIKKTVFGKTPDGKEIQLYVLTNKNGLEAAVTNFGGILVSLRVPDRQGKLGDIVLGYDSLDGYLSDKSFFGGTIGRYGNRIAQGKFILDGVTYTLARNNGENHLHGGIIGFNKVVWQAKEVPSKDGPSLQLNYLSKDGEEGYPGNLFVQVTYTLTDGNALKIDYTATTDKDTIVNLTNHSYFNLAGPGGDILEHQLMIQADQFTPVDAGLIPTGELRGVHGTPFDFRKQTAIGARVEQSDEQLKLGKGYDHNWVLNREGKNGLALAARVYEGKTGRQMEVWTTEPGIQFYSGNFLDGTIHGKGGQIYAHRSGFCLETQHFPDSPNQAKFPSTVLKPGAKYHTTTIYKFSAK
jgi:aldose 1-epimerase